MTGFLISLAEGNHFAACSVHCGWRKWNEVLDEPHIDESHYPTNQGLTSMDAK